MRPSPWRLATPVHADTKVGLDFQGLTGVPVITLEGGKEVGASTDTKVLVADPAAGQSMTQAARNALGWVIQCWLKMPSPRDTIANLKNLPKGLPRIPGASTSSWPASSR